ncbi:hypothetical protein IOD13_15380 [Brevibacterium casei]|nr:hypothetical protein [Brevibacterium casei]
MTATRSSPVVLLAGVPGAGKTETLKEIRSHAPWSRISDPESVRDVLRRVLAVVAVPGGAALRPHHRSLRGPVPSPPPR